MAEENKCIIFNIAYGSYVDGPGSRTTVFLKGCPLRCLWCCNSEGQSVSPEIKLEAELCTACGKCYEVCDEGALHFQDGKIVSIDRAKCTMCGKCVKACYMDAIDTFGRAYTVDEIMEIILRDKDYFDATGGGVTIGGGEPTMHWRFTGELMRRLHEQGIHVALDTCGYTVCDEARALLSEADLLLFDVKGIDPQEHKRCTGVSNELILRNLRELDAEGKPIIVRMPVIPGCNDDDATLAAEAELLASLRSLIRVDMIPYHDFGKIKFGQRGVAYPLEGTARLRDERVQEIKAILESRGLTVQIGG